MKNINIETVKNEVQKRFDCPIEHYYDHDLECTMFVVVDVDAYYKNADSVIDLLAMFEEWKHQFIVTTDILGSYTEQRPD